MASIIRIKRSSVSGNPSTLGAGELAYSALADNGSNGGDRLYIGMGTETAGNAASHVIIGGKYYTGLVDAGGSGGTLNTAAKSIPVLSATGTIDKWYVGNLYSTTNTISATNTNGGITLTPNGTGYVTVSGTNGLVIPSGTTAQRGPTLTASIRYNTDTSSFEGYSGTNWASLGGVKSVDGLTYIIAEATPGASDDTLWFYAANSVSTNVNVAKLDITSFNVLNTTDSSSSTTGAIITAGGVGIAKKLFVGGTGSITGALTLGTSAIFNGSTSGTTTVVATAAAGTTTLTLPAATDQLVGRATTDTLTNKTLTSPTINGGTHTGITSLGIRDTSAAFDVTIAATSSTALTAGRSLTLDLINASRTVKLAGNIDLAGNFTTAGAFGVTLTATALTSVTLPTTGTLSTLAGSESLTNKTISTGSTYQGNTIAIGYGGTGSTDGSITGSGALTYTAGGTNTNINLVPNGTGTVDVASKRITSLADPTQAQDAATKAYVDAVKTGLDIKDSVRAATTAPLTVTYSGVGKTLTNAGTQAAFAIDVVTLAQGERVLIKDQATASQNGIYTVTTVGSVSTNWVLTRAADFDNTPGVEITAGAFTFVEEGTTNADSGWVLTTNAPITLDTTGLVFAQFSGAGQITAGAGMTKTGNTLDVIGTTNRILVNADSIDIASTYVGQTSITTLGTIATGVWNGTIVTGTYGGTGVNNGSSTITLGGSLTTVGAFTTSLTATGNTAVTLPTTGTLATLAGAESLSNKTITNSSIGSTNPGTAAFTTLTASGLTTITNVTDATNLTTASVILSGGLSVTKAMYVGTNITGAGAATSTLDGFQIDGGTY